MLLKPLTTVCGKKHAINTQVCRAPFEKEKSSWKINAELKCRRERLPYANTCPDLFFFWVSIIFSIKPPQNLIIPETTATDNWPWIAVMAVRPIWVMQKSTDPIWTSVRPCWCHLCKKHSRAAWFLSTPIILMRKYWKEHSPYWLVPSDFNLYISIQIHTLFLQSFQGYLQVCLLELVCINS